ncbi:MAG: DUF4245 family protein [Pontimonas sp.]
MTEPTTPEEIAQAKAEARRLRRQRQTAKNLVASLVASLGIVLFLVLVVARPSDPVADPIDYTSVGAELEKTSGLDLAVPELDETWSANRADIRDEAGIEVWRIGLISTSGGFVQVVHVIGESVESSTAVPSEGIDDQETLVSDNGVSVTWFTRDRAAVEDAGNDLFVAWSPTSNGLVVVKGTSQAGVLTIASSLVTSDAILFQEAQ